MGSRWIAMIALFFVVMFLTVSMVVMMVMVHRARLRFFSFGNDVAFFQGDPCRSEDH